MSIIDEQNDLDLLCDILSHENVIGLDTEFIRTKTFYPDLSLIHVSIENNGYAVDMLANLDFEPLKNILNNLNIVKIVHSSEQDIQAIENFFNIKIKNIFDTQLAASWLKIGESISYSKLVGIICNKTLSKNLQFCDWKKRPIEPNKIEYAINDVKYLIEIYNNLKNMLLEENKLEWFLEESGNFYNLPEEYLWVKYKKSSNKIDEFLLVKSVLKHRHSYAKQNNISPNLLLKNENIPKLTIKGNLLNLPIDEIEEWFENKYFLDYFINNFDLDSELNEQTYKDYLNSKNYHTQSKKANLIKELADFFATKYNIPSNQIINKDELFGFVSQLPINFRFRSGFRFKIFGEFIINNMSD